MPLKQKDSPTPLRRSSEEIRSLVLDSARELFARQGYAGVSVDEIALHAGVGKRLIFSNFGTKADLFEVAVVSPFAQWLHSYFETWQQDPQGMSPQEQIHNFVVGYFSLVRENRDVLLTLTAARRHDGEQLREPAALIRVQLASALTELQTMTRAALDDHDASDLNPSLSVAVTASAVLGVALLDDWVTTEEFDDEALYTELTAMLTYGLLGRPAR